MRGTLENRRRTYLAFYPAIWALPSSTAGQPERTEDESVGEGEGLDHDETSSGTSESQKELQSGQESEPDQQPELVSEPEQPPELDSEPELQPEWEQDQERSSPQRVCHPPKVVT